MKKTILLFITICLVTSFSLAQEKGKFGITMRADPSPQIGMIYHISRKFALRPHIGFTIGKEKTESEFRPLVDQQVIKRTMEEDSTRASFGFGLLFYFYSVKDFSIYSGLNFSYTRETTESSSSWSKSKWETSGDIIQTNALFGLQCKIMEHLEIFGEVGFGYVSGRFDYDNYTESTQKIRKWGLTNSGVGIVFYF
ncbi:MAG: hypothetical protein U9O50_03965 [Acidobacteriota bacterium]|nr:hypothetical protein [Acidobacteriota bacterium]